MDQATHRNSERRESPDNPLNSGLRIILIVPGSWFRKIFNISQFRHPYLCRYVAFVPVYLIIHCSYLFSYIILSLSIFLFLFLFGNCFVPSFLKTFLFFSPFFLYFTVFFFRFLSQTGFFVSSFLLTCVSISSSFISSYQIFQARTDYENISNQNCSCRSLLQMPKFNGMR